MGETTKISWADATLNLWAGCTKVSVGDKGACEFCYAEVSTPVRAMTIGWGNDAPRHQMKGRHALLARISRKAKAAGAPYFVFVNSLSDFWDNKAETAWRIEAFEEFRKHTHVTFLLLTKRPQNILREFNRMVAMTNGPADLSGFPPNVALMCTAVTQAEADRDIPHLVAAAAALRPAFVGVSVEPMMEEVDLSEWLFPFKSCKNCPCPDPMKDRSGYEECCRDPSLEAPLLDFVICGGESGHHARPMNPDWPEALAAQCSMVGVAFDFKQWGEWSPDLDKAYAQTPRHHFGPGQPVVARIGKAAAGDALNGVVRHERPSPRNWEAAQ